MISNKRVKCSGSGPLPDRCPPAPDTGRRLPFTCRPTCASTASFAAAAAAAIAVGAGAGAGAVAAAAVAAVGVE